MTAAGRPARTQDGASGGSIALAFTILELVADEQPLGVSALARRLNRSKTTVHRTLSSLEAAGYVYRSGTPVQWRLTLRALSVGMKARLAFELRELAMPEMQRLLDVTQESIYLNVLDGHEMVVVDKLDSPHAIAAYTRRGERLPPHASSTGKAVLALLDDDAVEFVLPRVLERYTSTTVTEHRKLEQELERIRSQGYAVNDGERRADVVAVGAAILDSDGRPLGGLGVAAPRHRTSPQRVKQIAQEVMTSCKIVSGLVNGNAVAEASGC